MPGIEVEFDSYNNTQVAIRAAKRCCEPLRSPIWVAYGCGHRRKIGNGSHSRTCEVRSWRKFLVRGAGSRADAAAALVALPSPIFAALSHSLSRWHTSLYLHFSNEGRNEKDVRNVWKCTRMTRMKTYCGRRQNIHENEKKYFISEDMHFYNVEIRTSK